MFRLTTGSFTPFIDFVFHDGYNDTFIFFFLLSYKLYVAFNYIEHEIDQHKIQLILIKCTAKQLSSLLSKKNVAINSSIIPFDR